jgi:hypothetical protein
VLKFKRKFRRQSVKIEKTSVCATVALQLTFTWCPHYETGSMLAWNRFQHLELPQFSMCVCNFRYGAKFGETDKPHCLCSCRALLDVVENNQHYARIFTTALFHILAPTCFGNSLPSSGSFLDSSELPEIQIEWVVYHIVCGYVACVPECRGSVRSGTQAT